MDKTVFFSESGSWDNMVNLSTKSFPGDQFLVGARKVRVNASKKGRRPVLSQSSKAVLAEAYIPLRLTYLLLTCRFSFS